jgi:ParB-like chromosome segregation protein Spo0J
MNKPNTLTLSHCEDIRQVPVAELVEHPRNPNKHPERQLEALSKILKHQGFRAPIVVSKRSGFIVAGHGRLSAAIKAGFEKVPVSYQDFDTEADEWAHMIADNRIAELAERDDTELGSLIRDLDLEEFNLSLTGFEDVSWLEPDFEPGDKGDQGALDELEPKLVTCPHCSETFDSRNCEK